MADKMKLGDVVDIATQMEKDGQDRRDRFQRIDDAMNCVFEPDEAIKNLPYIQGRHIALTDLADSRNAGTRTFSSLLPDVNISPVADNEGEYERVEKLEQAWKWEMERMNRPSNGQKGVHDKIVNSAITYHAVALQTEYLPFKLKKQKDDPRVKAILRRKNFNWTVHHPGMVESKQSDYGLEQVLYKGTFTAKQLVDNFGENNKGIVKMRDSFSKLKPAELMRLRFTLYDYTDWEYRVQYISSEGANAAQFELMNEKHGLPFINWVIVDYGDPLWGSVLDSGTWDNLQHMSLMRFSKAVAMGMRSDLVVETPDGKLSNVWIDYKNPNNPIVVPTGSKVTNLQSNDLDPAFESQYADIRSDVSRSTVARVLQDTTPYTNAPFASLNAAITTALGQLSPAKRIAEAVEAEAIFQGFQWVEFSEIPFIAYRNKSSDGYEGKTNQQGEALYLTGEEPPSQEELLAMTPKELKLENQKTRFSTESMYISVELKTSNVEDEQAKLNTLILAKRELNMSQKEAYERMGWSDYEMNQRQRAHEVLFEAELQKEVQMKNLEVQGAAQQQQMMMQAQLQQQMNAGAQSPQGQVNQMNAGNQYSNMQGMDLRNAGGMSAARMVPGETRESVTGKARDGGAIA